MATRICETTKEGEIIPSRRITLPIPPDDYEVVISDATQYRAYLDKLIARYPELFPSAIEQGYVLHDVLPASKKLVGIRLRRIGVKTEQGKQVYTVAPSFVLPYMTGLTDAVEKALFLREFGVPFWALTYVFGHNDLYWYRLATHLGRYDLVGSTVKVAAKLPEDLLNDRYRALLSNLLEKIVSIIGAIRNQMLVVEVGGQGRCLSDVMALSSR